MANYVRNSGGIVTRFHSITTWWFGVVALNMYSTCTWMTAQTGQVSINVGISYPIVWHLLSPNLLYRISYGNGWKWIYTIHPKYMFNTLQTRGTRGVSLVSNFMDPMSAIPLWDCFKNIHMPHQQQWCFIIIKYIYIYDMHTSSYQLYNLDRNWPCEGIPNFKTHAYRVFGYILIFV